VTRLVAKIFKYKEYKELIEGKCGKTSELVIKYKDNNSKNNNAENLMWKIVPKSK